MCRALNIHSIALNIHTVALNIHTVALNIHTMPRFLSGCVGPAGQSSLLRGAPATVPARPIRP
eukprot:16527-Prorocentrum_minimum.AAC.1